jgi:predicted esterase
VNTNVCVVDWKRLSQNTPYIAAQSVDRVAAYTADFLKYLLARGFSYEHITMVGFSFGAHIAGITGHLLKGKVQKIIGLDPAGLFITTFSNRNKKQRLDKSSAKIVQAIHTAKYNIGTSVNVGHQDFFPSGGGTPQPGCIVPLLQSGIDFREYCV